MAPKLRIAYCTTTTTATFQDELLKAAVNLYGTSEWGVWVKIAEYVGHGVNNYKCKQRWANVLDPQLQLKYKTGPWLEEEVCVTKTKPTRLHQYFIELLVIGGVYYSSSNTRSVNHMLTGAAAVEACGGAQRSHWEIRLEAYSRRPWPFSICMCS